MKGYDRIGCYLCPTSRMAELELVQKTYPEYMIKWIKYLGNYAETHSLPRGWVELGLWRWRFRVPGEIRALSKRQGINIDMITRHTAEDYVEKIIIDRGKDLAEIYFKKLIHLNRMYSLTKIIELNATINDRKLTIHKKWS